MSGRAWPLPTAGRERLSPLQEESLDALCARFGDGRITLRADGIAEIVHFEQPGDQAWLVNPDGDVAEASASPNFVYSAEEVAQW